VTEELFPVVLRGVPVDIHRRAETHGATLRRELALLHTADQQGDAPARLLWLSHDLSRRYDRFSTAQRGVVDDAAVATQGFVDLHYRMPAHAADAVEELATALEEMDAYCRSGDLVTLAATDELLAYQRWFLGQFVEQLRDGRSPTSWIEWLASADGASGAAAGADAATATVPGDAAGPTRRAATITIADDLDLEGSAGVRSELVGLLDEGVVDLTVDLSRCAFIDSVGVSLLLTALETLEHAGGTLRVAGASGRTSAVLRTAGVLDVLTRGR
jgi:anti-anti-sigma factor